MSYVVAGPGALAAAASDLARIGSAITASNVSAALQTAGVPAAAADGVSAAVADFWSAHAKGYQQVSAQMSALHEQLVQRLGSTAASYANTEAAAAAAVRSLLGG
ncbi:PE family protein [Mycobacterium vicinigordonae]|uniref:PE family protein n=1 Tax=Mycobacterium vicinigordonae TaxID=1719132 RepID=A0A7D6DWJ5_9MYCO|nr:PE family protein [Mycobacterium vicinigordonae]